MDTKGGNWWSAAGGRGRDELGDWDGHLYTNMYKMDN